MICLLLGHGWKEVNVSAGRERKVVEILRYLWLRGRFPMEGTSSARQLRFLMSIVQRTNARRIAEIGFNTGVSSYAFLNAHPHTHVVAFDLNEHASARTARS